MKFRVAGYDGEYLEWTQPVQVTCPAGHKREFTYRDDGGADTTADLDEINNWASEHQDCTPAGSTDA